jgi:hypothetical protein
MISAFVPFILLVAFSVWFGSYLSVRYRYTKAHIFYGLIAYHIGLSLAYYIYGMSNPTDSKGYFARVFKDYRGESWGDFYGVSTTFIEFVGYPFIKFLNFDYNATMILFAWFGLMGFYFFYIALKERVRYKHTLFGYDLLGLILFLPNLHFWSGSFGKGSIIFLGFGLYFYALNKISSRWIPGILGAIIIYHVRPHILFVVIMATAWGFFFSTRGINTAIRVGVILVSIAAFYWIREDVLALTGISEEELFEDSTSLTDRAGRLSRATSGVDLSTYSFPMKVFTFWFRPLFIDAPGILGFIISFENLFYLIVFLKLFRWDFISFFRSSDMVVKTSFVTFLGVSAALAQICANLGIAMRQKSQVMILMMFVILKFLDEQRFWQEQYVERMKKIKANRAVVRARRATENIKKD